MKTIIRKSIFLSVAVCTLILTLTFSTNATAQSGEPLYLFSSYEGVNSVLTLMPDGVTVKMQKRDLDINPTQMWEQIWVEGDQFKLRNMEKGNEYYLDIISSGEDKGALAMGKEGNYSGQYWSTELPNGDESSDFVIMKNGYGGKGVSLDCGSIKNTEETGWVALKESGNFSGQLWYIDRDWEFRAPTKN